MPIGSDLKSFLQFKKIPHPEVEPHTSYISEQNAIHYTKLPCESGRREGLCSTKHIQLFASWQEGVNSFYLEKIKRDIFLFLKYFEFILPVRGTIYIILILS